MTNQANTNSNAKTNGAAKANAAVAHLDALRKLMENAGVDAYIVPTGDFHMSEYVADHFKTREYITGFTGSAGTAVITQDAAGLWTDSRYYLQAAQQLCGSGITLYKMQEPDVPSITDHLKSCLSAGQTVAFDGRIVSCSTFDQWKKELDPAGILLCEDLDLVGPLWEDRPARPANPAFELELTYAGRSRVEKLTDVRKKMAEEQADALFLSELSDIAWLLNIRGNDVRCNPVVFSYLLLTQDQVTFYAQNTAVSDELSASLSKDGIVISDYDSVACGLRSLPPHTKLWLPSGETSCYLRSCVPQEVHLIDKASPTILMKAVKNPTEQENSRIAHLRDGVAVTKWIYWLKENIKKETITELTAAEQLYRFRSEGAHFMGNSFDPIIAYGDHAAIVHYSATADTDIPLQPYGLLLADTGGQYPEGTTDCTRTIALGPLTEEEKTMYTAVLRGHIRLAAAVFRYGLNGANLDYLAHSPLWEIGKDYNHGTGHGVGSFLNVHEGPNQIHWAMNGNRPTTPAFEEGMITSDEPGYYEAGSFGIRLESLLLCLKGQKTEYGQFMLFEELTLIPFDLDAVDPAQMTAEEKDFLNAYHQNVYQSLAPHLTAEEKDWLRQATRAI